MSDALIRTQSVIGEAALAKLKASRVAVFGLGGVGGNCVEALARSGIGTLDLIDNDEVAESNLNRQLFATVTTVGMKKTDAAEQRIREIAPDVTVNLYPFFYLPDRSGDIPFEQFDYIVDAIDTVTAKLDLIVRAGECGVPIISSMGTGNRMDPSRLSIRDIYGTSGDPLAKVMRRELRKRGVGHLTVCASDEEPVKPIETGEEKGVRRSIPGSTAFVPASAGILIASYVVRDLIRGIPRETE